MNGNYVNVFPIEATGFGMSADWFWRLSPRLISPSYMLMAALLVISVGMMVLKRFEEVDVDKKLWNIPVIITIVAFWPSLVMGLKVLVDAFNSFLINEIFQIPWRGFGFTEIKSLPGIFSWTGDLLARLLPNLAYWIIYAFYILFFFFYAILGPFVIAKGILFDEIEAFLEVVKEITILFLWQTTMVILVAFILPEIVSGKNLPEETENLVFRSLVLGVIIFFVPTITSKFGTHLGSSFFPSFLRFAGSALALNAVGYGIGKAGAAMGLRTSGAQVAHRLGMAEDLQFRYAAYKREDHLRDENVLLNTTFEHEKAMARAHEEDVVEEMEESKNQSFLALSRRAKHELRTST